MKSITLKGGAWYSRGWATAGSVFVMIKRLIPILSILLILPACAVGNSLAQGDQPRISDVQNAATAVEPGCSESPDEGLATPADPF